VGTKRKRPAWPGKEKDRVPLKRSREGERLGSEGAEGGVILSGSGHRPCQRAWDDHDGFSPRGGEGSYTTTIALGKKNGTVVVISGQMTKLPTNGSSRRENTPTTQLKTTRERVTGLRVKRSPKTERGRHTKCPQPRSKRRDGAENRGISSIRYQNCETELKAPTEGDKIKFMWGGGGGGKQHNQSSRMAQPLHQQRGRE